VSIRYLPQLDAQYIIKVGQGKPDEEGNPATVTLSDGTKVGDTYKAKIVKGGEAVLGNLAKGIWLSLSNSRSFSLLGGVNEGIKYIYNSGKTTIRTLRLLGQTIVNDASGQTTTLGTVMRFFPGLGDFIVKNPLTQQGAVEATTVVSNPLTARPMAAIKLGDIFIEPITSQDTGILQPHTEAGAAGIVPAVALRTVLQAFSDTGLEVSSVKLDNLGNMSINAPAPGTGLLSISALTKIAVDALLIHLGTTQDVLATEPAVLGTALSTWLLAHTHGSGTGPTSPPIQPIIPLVDSMFSKKVFIT